MPKLKSAKKNRAAKPPTRPRAAKEPAAEPEEEVERLNILEDEESSRDGKVPSGPQINDNASSSRNAIPLPSQNVVDFEAFLRDSGLLDIQQGCGVGPTNELRSLINNNGGSRSQADHAAGIEPIRSLSDETYVHLPMSLREQIWKGEFINLSLLLKASVELSEICSPSTLCITPSGTIEARPKNISEANPSIERWTDAFLIYMSLLVTKKPVLSAQLIRYMAVIREAAQVRVDFTWRTYDIQFRLRQAANPRPWSEINYDLWMRCMIVSSPAMGASSRPFVSAAPPALGKCRHFNNGFCSWPNCSYLHACEICGDRHSKIGCPRQGGNRSTSGSRGTFRGQSSFRRSRGRFSFRRAGYGRGAGGG